MAGGAAALGAAAGPSAVPAQASLSPPSNDLCFKSARELASLIKSRKVSAREVMTAHLDQIRRVNPKVNAIVAKLEDDTCRGT